MIETLHWNLRMKIFRYAFVKSIPILFSYIFLGMAYGILMEQAGFGWYYSLLISLVVYTGAFQFVLTTLLSSGASLLTIGLTALFMNSRQLFYSISFVREFNEMGRAKPYMIHSLTDETYAVNTSLTIEGDDRKKVLLALAVMCQTYWCIGAVLGVVIGGLLPFSADGIDFSMTAFCDNPCGTVGKSTEPFPGSMRDPGEPRMSFHFRSG